MSRKVKNPQGKSKTKPDSKPTPKVSRSIPGGRGHLVPKNFHEWYHQIMACQITPDEPATWKTPPPHTWGEVFPFFDSGFDSQVLGNLLKQNPDLLFHPIVQIAVSWLHQRFRAIGERLPEPEVEEIERFFQAVIEGWAQGLLPGYTLVPPKQKRGRPRRDWREIQDNIHILDEYERVLEIIRQYKVRPLSGESKSKWRTRLIKRTIPEIWDRSGFSTFEAIPHAAPKTGSYFIDKKKPLPPDIIEQWVNQILSFPDTRPLKDYLAYCMVGFSDGENLSPEAVKDRISSVRPLTRNPKKKSSTSPRQASST